MTFKPASSGGGSYTLPTASTTVLGGVKVDGTTITINGSGVISSVSGGSGTVTSVNVSGGTTGLTASGGPVTSSGTITLAGTLAIANGGTGVTTSTGTGSVVLSTSPTLTTPNLGTPSALVGTNITGTAAGLTAGTVTTNANLTGPIYSTGNATSITAFTGIGTTFVMQNSPSLTSPTFSNPILGTPQSGTLTNCSGLPLSTGVTGVLPIANGGTSLSATSTYSMLTNSTGTANTLTSATGAIQIGAAGLTSTNILSSWSGSASTSYTQMNVQNTATAGQSGYSCTAADGNDTTHYAFFGMNNGTGPSITNSFFTNAHAASLYSVDSEFDFGALGTNGALNFYSSQYTSPNLSLVNSTLSHGIASSSTAVYKMYNASNANTVTIQSGVTSASYTMTLPTAVASAGQVLTDAAGNGVLSWTTPSGASPTFDTQTIWLPTMSVSYISGSQLSFTSSSATQAKIDANGLANRICTWTDTTGATQKRGFVNLATASGTTVTIYLYGDNFLSTDKNFRVTVPGVEIYELDWYIPGQQTADGTNPVGKQWINTENQTIRILGFDAFAGTAAAGTGAALTYNVYDNTSTALFSSAPSFGAANSVYGSFPINQTVAAYHRLTLRTPASAGATNVASDLNVCMYYCYDGIFSAF